jgi:PKD repeat protein
MYGRIRNTMLLVTASAIVFAAARSMAADNPEPEILKKLIVSITAEPDSGAAPLKVQFDVDLYDNDLEKPRFVWSFGDGGTAKIKNPVHVYKKPGDYKATLRVEDTRDRVGTDETLIVVEKKE